MKSYGGFVYILTTRKNTVLYTGVTSDLYRRLSEHKDKLVPKSFTARYSVDKLVYFEFFESIEEAIEREKQIKGWIRSKKLELIRNMNPQWQELEPPGK